MLSALEWDALRLSLQVALWAVAVAMPFAIAIGYGLARGGFGMNWLVETVVNLPLVMPPVATGYLLLVVLGRQGPVGGWLEEHLGLRIAFTWKGAAVAAAVMALPLMVRAVKLAFQSVDPRIELASRTLGAGRLRTFLRVSLPLARRGVAAAAILGFARSLGEFGATILLAGNIAGETRTLPLALFSTVQRPGGLEQSWRLVALSIGLAAAALIASEILERRGRRRELA